MSDHICDIPNLILWWAILHNSDSVLYDEFKRDSQNQTDFWYTKKRRIKPIAVSKVLGNQYYSDSVVVWSNIDTDGDKTNED